MTRQDTIVSMIEATGFETVSSLAEALDVNVSTIRRDLEHLAEAGQLRVQHRQASLEELGRLADPQMTKDAVAGRIRRLLSMADKRAEETGIADTHASVSDELFEE